MIPSASSQTSYSFESGGSAVSVGRELKPALEKDASDDRSDESRS
jgi:hypothetical protein